VTSTTARRPISLTPRGIIATLFVFAVAVTCIRLGFWQLDRRKQRAQINAAIESRWTADPVVLDHSPRDTTGWLFRKVSVQGSLDDARSIVLPGHSFRGAPGVHILTPLLLGNGSAVLVNRGWAPAADGATVELDSLRGDFAGSATGLVLPFPSGRTASSDAGTAPAASTDEFRRVWFAMDEAALRQQFPYELGRVQVQLLPGDSPAQLPLRLPPPALDPGPHLGYAIQWFSFAVIAVVGWFLLFMKSSVARSGSQR
jgi:surfeit locus 1 family protein